MDKDRLDEPSSAEENSARENNSVEENLAEECSTAGDSVEDSTSMDEDDQDLEMDEDEQDLEMDEDDQDSEMDEDDQDSEMDEDEQDLEMDEDEQDSEKDEDDQDLETGEDSAKDSSSTEEHSVEQSDTIESDIISEMLRDSTEDSSSEEEDSKENMKGDFIEKHGLVFQNIELEDRSVKCMIVGYGDCGRTELIGTVFCDPLSWTITKSTVLITEYKISLSTYFHIWICVVKRPNFFGLKKMTLSDKTVFLLCYDVDNWRSFERLQERWIPAILEKSMKEMYYLLVGMKRNPTTEPKAKKFKEEDRKAAIELKAKELNDKFCAGRVVECFIEDKHSLLNVFQSSLDFVYPCS